MPWKMDGDKIAVLNGDPVWIGDDAKETTVSGGAITRLNSEAKGHREAKEAAEAQLAKFAGIDDPAAAIEAMKALKDVDLANMVSKGKLDEVRLELTKTYDKQLGDERTAKTKALADLDSLRLTNAFTASKFVAERVAVPPDMFQATFANRFKVDPTTGKVQGMKADGTPIYSEKSPGVIADVDEAFELILKDYPDRDKILKAAPAKGSGNGGGGGNPGGGGTITRKDFEALNPLQKAEKAGLMAKGELQIVD